ncbi:MAG: helicase C-terminal domain-containing protein [Nanoarchaeota archaeon]|nr:helicase C-terminal domain-containing protein [Nanoarchaeota archaeon]
MWSLYNEHNEFLPAQSFSNGKTQETVVQEVLAAIEQGHKTIFLKGTPGTGKSAIALNIAKELGKTSIVVPVKYLQKQYEHDYTKKLYLKKSTGEKLNIAMMTGRNNHPCLYQLGLNADNPSLPCIIEIKKENIEQLHQYVEQNDQVATEDYNELKDYTRMAVAGACQYWTPILPTEIAEKITIKGTRINYEAVSDKNLTIIQRKPGCSYYQQFQAYKNADVIIFNSKKYELENLMNRKPKTELEIIDEGDEFLDHLSTEKKININHLLGRIKRTQEHAKDADEKEVLQDLYNLGLNLQKKNSGTQIMQLENNNAQDLINFFLRNPYLGEYEELANYYEIAISYEGYEKTTFVTYSKNPKEETMLHLVNIDLQKKLEAYTSKNKTFLFMSGTLHSKKVLQDIFGITDYCLIEAETKEQGTIKKKFTGKEKDFRYKNFNEGKVTREQYLQALEAAVTLAPRPVLVHVNSFSDLPKQEEQTQLNLNLMTTEKLQQLQEEGKQGQLMQLFKNKQLDVLYSTKCTRGVDFPGDQCNSIIYTKYPYPSMHDIFWKVLKQEQPAAYLEFYFDKAAREYKQRLYRGLRSKNDTITILSPDIKVLS